MNKFFVDKETYKERLDICRGCEYYFAPSGNCKKCGCFVRIKASIGTMSCPIKYWIKTTEVEEPGKIPEQLLNELKEVWENIKTKRAKNQEWKAKAIEIYNAIHNTKFKTGTNCSSCMQQVWNGLNNIINKNK